MLNLHEAHISCVLSLQISASHVCIFIIFFFLMIRRPPRSTLSSSSAASDVYKRQLQEIERANRYMNRLGCEDDMVFKALADRVRVFVRDVTPDMPEDLQVLLARGAAAEAAMPQA
eukprot:TRINITY_DN9510_c0_g1_i1.p1 TRINITY_DN9510_c0_g1~~TRINITY_DN9510_c0_g1_i1.p1  ORF type:complete len:116 (+),score=30.12 TRINITY_DN9510_c0_g1_i1:32-379(+)